MCLPTRTFLSFHLYTSKLIWSCLLLEGHGANYDDFMVILSETKIFKLKLKQSLEWCKKLKKRSIIIQQKYFWLFLRDFWIINTLFYFIDILPTAVVNTAKINKMLDNSKFVQFINAFTDVKHWFSNKYAYLVKQYIYLHPFSWFI